MEIVIVEPGKFSPMQQFLHPSPDIFPAKVVAALASHCCSSPVGFNHLISFYTAKHRTFPVLYSLSMPFSWHLPLQWHLTPGLPSPGQQHPSDLSRVPALGSVPPLGRYGTLQPTTSSSETVPGVVYWPRSSILSLHNYGVSMQGRGKIIFAALACCSLKLQLFA